MVGASTLIDHGHRLGQKPTFFRIDAGDARLERWRIERKLREHPSKHRLHGAFGR
jgi:hypothetical protein